MWNSNRIFTVILVPLLSVTLTAAEPDWPDRLIGCTELRTNLPGGRQANVSTMRATIRRADGSERQEVGHELIEAKAPRSRLST